MKVLKTVSATTYADPSFPLRFYFVTVNGPVPLHAHEEPELIIILEGVGEHATAHGSYTVGPGSVIYVDTGMLHAFKSMHGITFANIILSPERLLTFTPHIKTLPGYCALFGPRKRSRKTPIHFALPLAALPPIRDALQRVDDELSLRKPGCEAAAQSLLMYAVVLIVRAYQTHRGARVTKTPEQIEHILAWIHRNYAEPFDIDRLAGLAGLSRSQFFTAFKKYKGYSPLQYLIRTRVERAQELLHETERSITDIAFAVGFDDSNYFTRQFRKYTKTTPRTYRAKVIRAL